MEEITADADSESWALQKTNVARIFEEFLAQDDELKGSTFDALPASVLCARPINERLITFLVRTYKIPAGKKNAGLPLACDTVLNYLGTCINRSVNKCRLDGSLATKEFSFCLDANSSSESAVWLLKLKQKTRRIIFERAKEKGEAMDNSETPLYIEHTRMISRAYARVGTAEAATRNFAVESLRRAAGRSAETAWLCVTGLKWDAHFKHVFAEWPQPKGSKLKLAAFGAGIDRECDWFVKLGDYLILQPDREIYAEDGPTWLFPKLQKTKSPGTTMGNFIRALLPADRGGQAEFQDARIVLPKLPPGANAGGIRPGVCNMLNAKMPADIVVMTTAHDMTKTSALYEYVDATRAGCMPGCVVLGGFPALPWGQLGMGPMPASLAPLEAMGVSMDTLEGMMDDLFRLDSASPPMLWRNGSLRPMVHAAFATEIMYFDERAAAGETSLILSAMINALKAADLVDDAAPNTFRKWAIAIKKQFDLDNLHLTGRTMDTSSVQAVAALQGLGHTVGGLHAQVASLQHQINSLQASPTAASPTAASPTDASPAAHIAVAASPTSPLPHRCLSHIAASPIVPAPPPPPPAPPPAPFGGLLPAGDSASPAVSMSGLKAADFYASCMLKGGAVPTFKNKQEKPKAEVCVKMFNAMSDATERTVLKPPQPAADGASPLSKAELDGQRRIIAVKLNRLVVARLIAAYEEGEISVPRDFGKPDYQLPASGVATHVDTLKPKVTIDFSTLASWRKANEEKLLTAVQPPPRKKAKR